MGVQYNETFKGYRTANELLTAKPFLAGRDGVYMLCPDGTLSSATPVYCDMTTDGGGWMLVARSHEFGTPKARSWGWLAEGTGELTDFSQPYQLPWFTKWHANGNAFSSFIFGNRLNVYNNQWGPFIYKHTVNYSNLINLDTMQSTTTSVIKTDLTVYETTAFPSMQLFVGYSTSALTDNSFFLRDYPGIGYGGYPNGMFTTYVNDPSLWFISGPWGVFGNYNKTTRGYDSNGDYIQKSGNTRAGGVPQYMIMVR